MNTTIDTPLNVISLENNNFNLYRLNIVELYRQVFSESSWKEGWKCSCGFQCSYWDIPDWFCSDCWEKMQDYYSQEEIEWFVKSIFEKDYYQALLWLSSSNKVVAFTWWWIDNLVGLNDEKLWLCMPKLKELRETLKKRWYDIEEAFYYQSETWVDPREQWKWYGKDIISINQDILRENQDKVSQVIQRTSKQSRMFNMRLAQWYELVYEYCDAAERVLFAKKV